ncbi:hypothetical protein KCP77_08290 [Salmonella enterica subsp. enterica]|nr:hypothetical protein KCP77_08290 [Salmonella enterica subsp. enterica]
MPWEPVNQNAKRFFGNKSEYQRKLCWSLVGTAFINPLEVNEIDHRGHFHARSLVRLV